MSAPKTGLEVRTRSNLPFHSAQVRAKLRLGELRGERLRHKDMSAVVDRLLALARWRWTPFVGLAAGSASFVLTLAWMVPDRIGSASAPPPRSPIPELGVDPPESADEEPDLARSNQARPSPARATATTTRRANRERRRGFSPVVRSDEPSPDPGSEEPPVQQITSHDVADDGEEPEALSPGRAAAARATRRAQLRAAALANREGTRRRNAEQGTEPAAAPPGDDDSPSADDSNEQDDSDD